MTNGIETSSLSIDPSVDPVVLAVMFVAFLIGAVGPFAWCVIGSVREERAMRRYAAEARQAETGATVVDNPVGPDVVPAAVVLNPAVLDIDAIDDPANDFEPPAERAVRS